MKKNLMIGFIVFAMFGLVGFVNASSCNPGISLLNQDPYPAIPGEYVKLVFQIDGLSSTDCGQVYLELVNDYPIRFDAGSSNNVLLNSGTYVSDYTSNALVPFKVRVNESALDGENEIWVKYSNNYLGASSAFSLKKFSLVVNNTKADFEVSITDYDSKTGIATFDILNTGKNGVEGLTVDLLKQDAFDIKGSTRAVIGSLNANDDTTFTFEGYPKKGEITLIIRYNDKIGVRREMERTVIFDPALYTGRIKDQVKPNYAGYIVLIIIIVLIVIWQFNRSMKKKRFARAQMLALKRK